MEEKKKNFLIQNGIDIEKGIENTLDFETYDEILLDFCNSFPEEVKKFNTYKINEDWVNYEIIVHALKSNFRTLGFIQEGELFYQHELAVKENRINWILENYVTLAKEVNRLYKVLLTYKGMN